MRYLFISAVVLGLVLFSDVGLDEKLLSLAVLVPFCAVLFAVVHASDRLNQRFGDERRAWLEGRRREADSGGCAGCPVCESVLPRLSLGDMRDAVQLYRGGGVPFDGFRAESGVSVSSGEAFLLRDVLDGGREGCAVAGRFRAFWEVVEPQETRRVRGSRGRV